MRIGLNLLYMLPGRVGGTETYAAGLLYGLSEVDAKNQFLVLLNQESANWLLPERPNFTRLVCPVNAENRARRYAYEQVWLPGVLRKEQLDLVHSLGYVAPLLAPCPSLVTIHDLNFRVPNSDMAPLRRWMLKVFVTLSARRACHVITVSEFSRKEIVRHLGLPPQKITVIPEAPQTTFLAGRGADRTAALPAGIRLPYVTAFSATTAHKNISRLLQAFARADLPHQLVLIGHATDSCRAQAIGLNVFFTGYVEEQMKLALLAEADFLVFPSWYEGFGLPLLEAMALGVPVVSSNRAALPEVGADAAVYFDPFSVADMASAIRHLALDAGLRAQMRERGRQRAIRFSWPDTARQTLVAYSQAKARA